jgi:RNA recognition motif-containing protein
MIIAGRRAERLDFHSWLDLAIPGTVTLSLLKTGKICFRSSSEKTNDGSSLFSQTSACPSSDYQPLLSELKAENVSLVKESHSLATKNSKTKDSMEDSINVSQELLVLAPAGIH